MGRVILTTVGTSAFDEKKLVRLDLRGPYNDISRHLQGVKTVDLGSWVQDNIASPRIERFIASYLEAALYCEVEKEVKKPASGGVNIFSAEVSSLYLMYENKELKLDPAQDAIIFLLSESAEGVLAGIINQRLLAHPMGLYLRNQSAKPQLKIVPGLQMENFSQFHSQGLRVFADCIRQATATQPQDGVILNITGGFKSSVPYSTLFAFAFDVPVVFTFEEMTDLVKLKLPTSNLTQAQRAELIGGLQKAVIETFELEPDLFDAAPR